MTRATRFTPTHHAAVRLIERVHPNLSEARAFQRLAGYAVRARPLIGQGKARQDERYIVPGTDLVLVVEDKKIVTIEKRAWRK